MAHGSRDPRSARTVRAIAGVGRSMRSNLTVAEAFLDHNEPALADVVDRLAATGHRDIVLVPLFLTSAYHVRADIPAVVEQVQRRHPDLPLTTADVLGSGPELLTILDQRLGEVLRRAGEPDPDALVLASAGSSDHAANESIAQLARRWGERHRLPASVAFASAAPPSTSEAVANWRRRGRRRVAVGSLFIAPGRLPDRARDLALDAGARAVARPLGEHPLLAQMILDRYDAAASRRLTAVSGLQTRHWLTTRSGSSLASSTTPG